MFHLMYSIMNWIAYAICLILIGRKKEMLINMIEHGETAFLSRQGKVKMTMDFFLLN